MSTQIIGGRRNSPMNVGVDGRARVLSTTHSAAFHSSLNENAFLLLAEVNLTDTSLTPILHLKNIITGFKDGAEQVLCIQDILFSGNANLHFEVFFDETYTSGGTSVTPTNMFVGSSREPDVTAFDNSANNLVLASDGNEIESTFLAANSVFNHNYDGAIVLRNQKTLSVKVQGTNTDKARVTLNFFYASLAERE